MTRVDDRPVPTIGGHRPDVEPWPAQLFIGIERQPIPFYVYDDETAFYDDLGDAFVYDDAGAFTYDRFDLFCDFHGLTIETGSPNEEGDFDAGHIEMTLDNRDGALSQYDAQGRLVDWQPGSPIDIWATFDGEDFWLFSGRISAWRERADGTIEVEAFDAFSELNEEAPEWNPGVFGDTPAQRLTAICTLFGFAGVTRFDTGDVTLHSFFTDATPLEEMQAVAQSDGGHLVCDADGTLVYRDRRWLVGRTDQTEIPTFSDNYCDAPITVWEAEKTTDDEVIVNKATMTNVADITVNAVNTVSIGKHGPQTLPGSRRSDQWITEADGQELADFLVNRRGDHYLRLERFALYLHDPRQDLWTLGIDRRLGDIVTWVHEQQTVSGPGLIILNLAVQQITHEITPESWVTTIATTRTVGNRIPLRYDRTLYRYDDPAALYAL